MTTIDPHHVCVHCGCPTPILHRLLSGNHIKLVECKNCHRDVDPYIEREMLLVMIDLILLRSSAYKHILFNRPVAEHVMVASFMILFCSTFLRVASDSHENKDIYYGYHILLTSAAVILDLLCLTLLTGISALLVFHHVYSPYDHKNPPFTVSVSGDLLKRSNVQTMDILRAVTIAIVPPQLFSAITAFVHIYEPSTTIRNLGAFFITCSRWVGVDSVMTCYYQYFICHSVAATTKDVHKNHPYFIRRWLFWILQTIPALPFLVAFIGSMCIRSIFTISWLKR